MVVKKKCFCCNDSEPIKKSRTLKNGKIKYERELIVLLVRLEDDPKLSSYVTKQNVHCDNKKLKSFSVQNDVEQGASKEVTGDTDSGTSNACIATHSSVICDTSNQEIAGVSTINNMLFDYSEEINAGSVPETKKFEIVIEKTQCSRPCDIISKPTGQESQLMIKNNVEIRKESDDCRNTLSSEVKMKARNYKPGPASKRKHKVEEKINNDSNESLKTISNISSNINDNTQLSIRKDLTDDHEAVKIPSKRKISPHIEEPLNLISKLTGCQIPPSKVKVLPLNTSCCPISTDQHEKFNSTILLSNNTDETPGKKESSSADCNANGVSCHSNPDVLSSENKNKCHNGKNLTRALSEKVDVVEEVRTVYDLMEYISVVMPSWNLHILSDTNTFCICQVTRSKRGYPQLSKCIELDDNFNGKVYIYQKHCQRFDGVYNSEDAVVALIKEVDSLACIDII